MELCKAILMIDNLNQGSYARYELPHGKGVIYDGIMNNIFPSRVAIERSFPNILIPNIGDEHKDNSDSLLLNLLNESATPRKTIKHSGPITTQVLADLGNLVVGDYRTSILMHPDNFEYMKNELNVKMTPKKDGRILGSSISFEKFIVDELVPQKTIYAMPTCEYFGVVCLKDRFFGMAILNPDDVAKLELS